MNISSIGCGTEGVAKTAAELNAEAEKAVTLKGWCVFMIHSIDNDTTGYSSLRSKELEDHLNYIAANSGKFWVNTFGNVVRYIKERNAVSLTEQSVKSNRITLQLTDSLDNSIYNYPISIRRPLPARWKIATVTQGKVKLTVRMIRMNPINFIQFDAIPNGGTIVIQREINYHAGKVKVTIQELCLTVLSSSDMHSLSITSALNKIRTNNLIISS